jgi:hypothetical protein
VPPIVLTLAQALLLILLYLFVWRALRVVIRDVSAASRSQPAAAVASAKRGRGGPVARSAPTELVVRSPDGHPRVIPLDGQDITFGRAETSTVVISDPFVSDAHARVYYRDGAWVIDDLGSTNGTYLNQARVTQPQPLAAGDQLAIGKTVVQVRR